MFQFPGCASFRITDLQSVGLPHSEICTSKAICASVQLIAAYHVLHRPPAPRHPLCALCNLILFSCSNRRNLAVFPKIAFVKPSGFNDLVFLPCMQMSKNSLSGAAPRHSFIPFNSRSPRSGGPSRTRTCDPRLIKAVL